MEPVLEPVEEVRAHLGVGDGQAEVGNDGGAVAPHQDVLALDVPVGDGGLALGAVDLCVQVHQARHRADQQPHRLRLGQGHPGGVVTRGMIWYLW